MIFILALARSQYTRRCSEDGQTSQGQVMACRAQCASTATASERARRSVMGSTAGGRARLGLE